MNTSTEHILQSNQSEPLADASGRIVNLMNENGIGYDEEVSNTWPSWYPSASAPSLTMQWLANAA